ncbi:DUF2378 family protein [Pyxidicoccus parkwayensis]|uniref:DUF2378 family protein n=1 Tax=Pyxidicoccus parkwayensis TaxID=2813578 RepID=A0ABX7NQF8_9BACT|nr:DUF2378 family protein [Pyxidicoccus parkwaysis]QSQ21089.1 DUF2378 family protein [Pyxidicoccus parkwaysis]
MGRGAVDMETPDTRLIYLGAVQGLFLIALRGRLSPAAREALRAEGLDLDQDLMPAYAFTSWLRWQDIILRDVWPDLPRDEAFRKLGRTVIDGLLSTMLGRVMATAARTLGPRLGLPQLDRGFRSSNNFQCTRVLVERGPNACELWINDIADRPTYYVGLLEAVLGAMGARESRITVLRHEPPGCTFLVEWRP